MKIRVKEDDGTISEITYNPTKPEEQSRAVMHWLTGVGGRRPSEAAMEVADMSPRKLRQMYKNLVITGVIKHE